MSELRPCPFCGERVYIDYDYVELSCQQEIETVVMCKECGAMSKPSAAGNLGADQYWNTRPIEDALQARIDELERRLINLTDAIEDFLNDVREKPAVEKIERAMNDYGMKE